MRTTPIFSLFIFLFFLKSTVAQEFSVSLFHMDLLSLSAEQFGRRDTNNKRCAILKIKTRIEGVKFDCALGFTGNQDNRNGEIWLYLSPSENRIGFFKEGFARTDFNFVRPLESGSVYLMELEEKSSAGQKTSEPGQAQASPVAPAGLPTGYAMSASVSLLPPVAAEIPVNDVNIPAGFGNLYVNSTPPEADIYIDTILQVSKTPHLAEQIKTGWHQVTIKKAGYSDVVKRVLINADKTVELDEVLPSPIEVMINSEPQGARLVVDGKILGNTPVKIPLLMGDHNIRLVLPDFYTLHQTLSVAKTTAIVTLTMKPEVKFEMVLVEGGTFNMGSNKDVEEEKPVHSVSVSNYSIGKYEVTQQQWFDIMGKNPAKFTECLQCPVESVSWNDISDFLQKLNTLSGKKYRLPTEAEWEYAARGGNKSKGFAFSGSNKAEDVSWLGLNSTSKTHPVGEKIQNELGICDMSGNLYEWCNDFYDETYYSRSPVSNPAGAEKGSYKILRGGCWISPASSCDVTSRRWELPSQVNDLHGFRLVLTQ